MGSFVRISALLWADILVGYALFVMQNYLTNVWKLSFTHAAGILNVWNGISMILLGFFLFLVDAVLGNFRMLAFSSVAYSVGIGFVAMSTPPVLASSVGRCKEYEPQCIGHAQKVLFYIGMALIAVGMAGNSISVRAFIDEQTDKQDGNQGQLDDGKDQSDNKKINNIIQLDCSQLPGLLVVVVVSLAGAIALPYIKPWTLRFGIPAICTLLGTLLFLSGRWIRKYKKVEDVETQGSPVTNVCRVFVAFAFKISQSFPLDNKRYYRKNEEAFTRTRFLRRLEKAAIILPGDISEKGQVEKKWRICSVGEVEEAKIAVRMVPMWLTFIVCGIVSSIGNTYFMEQANHMNRKIGKWKLPLQALLLVSGWFKIGFGMLADCLIKRDRTYGPPKGLGVAMIFSVLCCITAAKIETKRLNVIRDHGLLDKPDDDIPMSVYWLLFQFFLLAGLDSFFEKSVCTFYADQSPDSMKGYLNYFAKGVFGLGFMCSVLSVYVVGKVSEKVGGKRNWFQYTLNMSRLDRYFWVLAVLCSLNLIVFVVVASIYKYKNWNLENRETVDAENAGVETGDPEEAQKCSCFC